MPIELGPVRERAAGAKRSPQDIDFEVLYALPFYSPIHVLYFFYQNDTLHLFACIFLFLRRSTWYITSLHARPYIGIITIVSYRSSNQSRYTQ